MNEINLGKSQNNNITDSVSLFQNLLQKENQTLKSFGKNKIDQNATLSSLISVLELQRERISYLEEGKGSF